MKHCTNCGTALPIGNQFCGRCGFAVADMPEMASPPDLVQGAPAPPPPIQKLCPFCKSEISGDTLKCRYCGKSPSQVAVVGEVVQAVGLAMLSVVVIYFVVVYFL